MGRNWDKTGMELGQAGLPCLPPLRRSPWCWGGTGGTGAITGSTGGTGAVTGGTGGSTTPPPGSPRGSPSTDPLPKLGAWGGGGASPASLRPPANQDPPSRLHGNRRFHGNGPTGGLTCTAGGGAGGEPSENLPETPPQIPTHVTSSLGLCTPPRPKLRGESPPKAPPQNHNNTLKCVGAAPQPPPPLRWSWKRPPPKPRGHLRVGGRGGHAGRGGG